jgi:hypothetical protein
LIAGCILLVALMLLPIALGRTGSGGPLGLAVAAAICLGTAWLSEALVYAMNRHLPPLALMLLGMGTRLLLPLGVCLALAVQGANGREYLAFLCYLLTFYLATLAVETWLTVRRVAGASTSLNFDAR